jgi:hypothetical protein
MQYFQNVNSKQILGRSAAAKCRARAKAGEIVRGTSAIATATSILFNVLRS